MDTANLFYSLSQAICLSLMQGLITLLLVRLVFFIFPGISSIWKYRILLGCLILLLVGFSFSIYRLYSPATHIITSYAVKKTVQNLSLLAVIKHFLQGNSTAIFSAYVIGFLVNTLSLLTGLYKINQLKKSPGLQEFSNWTQTLVRLQHKFKISRRIRLLFSEKQTSPFTTGFLKPVIYFPIAMLSHLSLEQVEAILLHELAHIKRNDYLINIIQKLIETILFFNPAVWLLARSLKSEREYCCDDLVLHFTCDAGLYARALLSLEENRIDYNNLAMAADGARKHSLLNRIKRLKVMEHVNSNPKHKLIAIVGLVAISVSLAWAIPADSIKVKKEKAKIGAKRAVPPPAPLPVAPLEEAPPPPPPALPVAPDTKDTTLPPPPPPAKNEGAVQDTNKLTNYFNSDEWKKQQEALKKNTDEIQKYFQSAEWKAQQKLIAQHAENLKKHQKSMTQHAENIKKHQKSMAQHAENIKKHFETPEWKAQIEELHKDIQNKFNSEEWRKQMDEVKKQVEEVKIEKQNVEIEKKKVELEIKINDEKQLNENKNFNIN